MEFERFYSVVKDLFSFFRQKWPPESAARQWFNGVSHIPSAALPEIVEYIHDRDSLPRNVPKCFHESWDRWKKEHPEQVERLYGRQETNCPHCLGTGYIIVTRFVARLNRDYRFAARCGKCDNCPNNILPEAQEDDYLQAW